MAKYDVTYKCGHTCKTTLYGKLEDRRNKIDWYKENAICPDCYKLEKEAQEERTEQEKKFEEHTGDNMKHLNGSDSQINWASQIRIEKYAEAEKMKLNLLKATERQRTIATAVLDRIFDTKLQASWWIDNRSLTLKDLIEKEITPEELTQLKNT